MACGVRLFHHGRVLLSDLTICLIDVSISFSQTDCSRVEVTIGLTCSPMRKTSSQAAVANSPPISISSPDFSIKVLIFLVA
jgi:hypothetical protein